MKVNLFTITIILFLTIPLASAEYNKQYSIDWLQENTNWQQASIEDATMSFSVLKSNNVDVNTPANILLQRQDPSGCFPSGNCNVKDTAFGLLLLKNLNQETNHTLTWLASAETRADIRGKWLIQILTTSNGTCSISHNNKDYNFTIDSKGKIQPYNVDWLDIKNNLGINIEQPVEAFLLDCTKLKDSNTIISLLRQTDDELYIVQQENSDKALLEVNSACFPQIKGRACDIETTFLASWAINRANSKINTVSFLEDNAQSSLHYAILNQITSDNEKYVKILTDRKNKDNYWDSIYTTSFAADSLKYISSPNSELISQATSWLKTQQIDSGENKGSFNNGNLHDTAATIFLGLAEGSSYNPPAHPINKTTEKLTYCGDNIRQQTNSQGILEECDGADSSLCPVNSACQSCKCIKECQQDSDCVDLTKYCDLTTRQCNSLDIKPCNTNSDCLIGKICVGALCILSAAETTTTTVQDTTTTTIENNGEKEKSSLFKKIIIPLIIILILGLGIFFYRKYSKPLKREEDFFPPYEREEQKPKEEQKQQPARKYQPSPKDESIERELEKSLREARDLFKKK